MHLKNITVCSAGVNLHLYHANKTVLTGVLLAYVSLSGLPVRSSRCSAGQTSN